MWWMWLCCSTIASNHFALMGWSCTQRLGGGGGGSPKKKWQFVVGKKKLQLKRSVFKWVRHSNKNMLTKVVKLHFVFGMIFTYQMFWGFKWFPLWRRTHIFFFQMGWFNSTTNYLWTPKPWKMKVLNPRNMGYNGFFTPKNWGNRGFSG